MIRQIPLASHRPPRYWFAGVGTMALLFAADRLDHLEAEVPLRLRRGIVVISDRYDLESGLPERHRSAERRRRNCRRWLDSRAEPPRPRDPT
jgi:hypothetical protein